MEQRIARIHKNWAQDLDPHQYLFSLLEAATQAGLVDESVLENTQVQIMGVLEDIIRKYTSGESSSVKVEVAQSLILSIVYCVDAYLMSLETPEACLAEIIDLGISELYKKGVHLVRSYFAETKQLYKEVLNNRLITGIVAYNSTIDGLATFFVNYDVRFNAHETPVDIDYPLSLDPMNTRGVFYIRQYLQKMSIENQICSLFSRTDVDKLLENYGRTYRIDYQEFLLNIFEIVLANAMFSMMMGRNARILAISAEECATLNGRLKRVSHSDIPIILEKAAENLINELNLTEPEHQGYVSQCAKNITPRLINALKTNTLNKLAITEHSAQKIYKTTFEQGANMDDEDLRDLISVLENLADPKEKVNMILTRIQSLDDFLEVLGADCLFNEEYQTLYKALGDLELSLLVRTLIADDLREIDGALPELIERIPASNKEWVRQLLQFIQHIGNDRLGKIEDLVREMGEWN
ncbi:MAG: DUF6179 domain-containing protein [Candidatus Saccharibacteria bacterium]